MSNLKVNTINDANGGSAAVLYGVASPPNSMGFRNRIINGDMRIDQRNNGASVSINGAFPVDRWSIGKDGGTVAASRSTVAPAGFTNSLLFSVTTGYTPTSAQQNNIRQYIEGFNVADLGWGTASAQTVTMSFWVRSSLTGTFSGSLMNSAYDRSYVFTFSISAANTWEYKTVTITGDTSGTWLTDNSTGIRLFFDMGSGSNYNAAAGAWGAGEKRNTSGAVQPIATTGATFYITGVQLEAGTKASEFDRRDYGRELMMCQRYFRSMQRQAGNDGTSFAMATCYGNTDIYISNGGAHPVEMRATPTLSTVSTFRVEDGYSTTWTVSSIGIGASNSKFFSPNIQLTTTATAGRVVYLQATSDASRIQLSAEL
jgi:hypothetical protein